MTFHWIERFSENFRSNSNLLIPLLFIFNLVLVFPIFFPNLSNIDPWDESIYINSGRGLIDGGCLRQFAGNPLLSFLYALIYIPVKSTTFWLIHSCTIGRFILFSLMWFSAYLVATQLRYLAHPFIMIALLFTSPALTYLLPNPSDALFTAMSAFTLWQVLLFYNKKKVRHVWLASLFVGLSALSRNDGLILFFILIIIAVILSIPAKRLGTSLIACVIPFIILVAGYLIIYGLVMGRFELGIIGRTYLAFEQGQGFAYEKSPADGQIDARQLFGTPEENQYSFLSAIKRNPEAFFDRVRQTIKTSPKKIYFIYGERLGIISLLLAAMGAMVLARKRLYPLLVALLLWSTHLFVYFLTFFRHEYFLFPYFAVFSLASMGLTSIVYSFKKRIHYCWSLALLGLAIFGMLSNRPNLFSATVFFLVWVWIVRYVMNRYRHLEAIKTIGLVLALCALLFLKVGYPYPKFRTLGTAPDEKAVLFMKEHLKPGSLVFAAAPGPIWEAKMNFGPLDFTLRDKNENDLSYGHLFYGKAVYANDTLRYDEPGLVSKIERLIGKGLEVGYESENKEVQILLVDEKYSKKSTCSIQCHTKMLHKDKR